MPVSHRLLPLLQLLRCWHTSASLAKHNKPRMKSIPVSTRKQQPAGPGSGLLNLTPEALKKKIEERNAAEASDPRLGLRPEPDTCHITQLFEPQRHPLTEILRRHREFACPEMLNNPAGRLYATCLFNMSTAKSLKFIAPFSKVIRLPHLLPESVVRRHAVLAFCASPELAATLKEKGALDAGGSDLITKLETGVYIQENFDYVICHPDFWPTLMKARKLLKDALPAPKSAQVSEELEAVLELYRFGSTVKLTQAGDIPDRAHCKVPFGLLDWPDFNIDMNLSALLGSLLSEKPKKSHSPNFLMSVGVTCPPSDEVFLLDLKPYLADEAAATVGKTAAGVAEDSQEE